MDVSNESALINKLKIIELALRYKEYRFVEILASNLSANKNLDKNTSNILLEIIYKNYDQSLIMINNYLSNNVKAIDNNDNYEISIENDEYSVCIKNIENLNFEKIRRYCNNLADNNQADKMAKGFAKNGKMYKALVYDAMEQFLEDLEDENLTIIDWGCGQGLAVSLVLDYINEKQLDIEIEKVILIDEDEKALQRASLHVDVLKEDDFEIEALHVKDRELEKELDVDDSTVTLNLFANDVMPVDFLDIDYDVFNEAYFVCLSHKNKNFVDDVHEELCTFIDISDVSARSGKVGMYHRFERICKKTDSGDNNIQEIDINIDDDEILF